MVNLISNLHAYVSIRITNIFENFIINSESVRINIRQCWEHKIEREMKTKNGQISLSQMVS